VSDDLASWRRKASGLLAQGGDDLDWATLGSLAAQVERYCYRAEVLNHSA